MEEELPTQYTGDHEDELQAGEEQDNNIIMMQLTSHRLDNRMVNAMVLDCLIFFD